MDSRVLSDFDELLSDVRERQSRRLIEESIAAYRGGALRSAIVSTWIAVVADLFAKLRELASMGDKQAQQKITELDQAIQNSDISALQRLERDLAESASVDFGFFSSHELEDLKRLQKDRHLCAHPALVAKEILFQPTPELVRTHIVHALLHLLTREPVQGKAALRRIFEDIRSVSFPSDRKSIARFLKGKYLGNPKPSLVRNLLEALLKVATGSEADFLGKERYVALAFVSVGDCQPGYFEELAPACLGKIIPTLPEDHLLYLPRMAASDPRIWAWIPEHQRIQIVELIKKATHEQLKSFDLFDALELQDVRDIVLQKFGSLSREDQINILAQNPIPGLKSQAIELFAGAASFRSAEVLMRNLILPQAPSFQPGHVDAVLKAILENGQISQASEMPELLGILFDSTEAQLSHTKGAWRYFVAQIAKGKGRKEYYAYPEIRDRLKRHGIMKR